MTNMLWDVKSARDLSCQLLGNTAWSFAVKGEPSITVMVIQIPAKALSTDFKAQVIASGYRACLGSLSTMATTRSRRSSVTLPPALNDLRSIPLSVFSSIVLATRSGTAGEEAYSRLTGSPFGFCGAGH